MKKTICLNMIVKDESPVIKRCLESVKGIIDYWVIVDTGSTDGTQEIIKEFLKDIPGELYEKPWVNFGHNRNEALSLATDKADYIFFIDADDRLVFSEDFVLPELEGDGYWMLQKESGFKEHNHFCLMKNRANIRWQGVLHEYLVADTPQNIRQLKGVFNEYINDGNRSKDPEKIRKEIVVLKEGIKNEPLNARYQIYMGRAYWFLKEYDSSLNHFKIASTMKGTEEELYYSRLFIALCQQLLSYPNETVINSFSEAYLFRPSRAEAPHKLASYHLSKKNYLHAYLLSKIAMQIPKTTDNLFVESWIYDWEACMQFFECSKAIGATKEAVDALEKLLANPKIPEMVRQQHLLEEWQRYFIKSSHVA